jgi:hypothetical protein
VGLLVLLIVLASTLLAVVQPVRVAVNIPAEKIVTNKIPAVADCAKNFLLYILRTPFPGCKQ